MAPPPPSSIPPNSKPAEPTPASSTQPSAKPPASAAAPAGSSPLALTEDARKYLAAAAGSLRRLHDLLPLLEAIDRRSVVPVESLEITEKDLRDIRGELLAVLPPRSIKPTHDMIFRGCSLALQAVTARLEAARQGNTAGDWNTASAAAGAMMLIQRGRAALGQPAK